MPELVQNWSDAGSIGPVLVQFWLIEAMLFLILFQDVELLGSSMVHISFSPFKAVLEIYFYIDRIFLVLYIYIISVTAFGILEKDFRIHKKYIFG